MASRRAAVALLTVLLACSSTVDDGADDDATTQPLQVDAQATTDGGQDATNSELTDAHTSTIDDAADKQSGDADDLGTSWVADAAPLQDMKHTVAADVVTPPADGATGDAFAPIDDAAGDTAHTQDAQTGADALTPDAAPATKGGALVLELAGASDDAKKVIAWLKPGSPATLIYGPQLSYHVWISVCMPDTIAKTAKLAITMRLQETKTMVIPGITKLTTKIAAVSSKPGQLCRIGVPAFVICACEVNQQIVRVRVDAEATNKQGKVVKGWAESSIVPVHVKGPCAAKGSSPCHKQLP